MSDDKKNGQPTEAHMRAAKAMQYISDALLTAALEICAEVARQSGDDNVFFVPVIQLHAVKADESQLLGSVVHFQAGQDLHQIAKLMRIGADHLEGCGPKDHHVVRDYLQ
jgi:hypothetical protein